MNLEQVTILKKEGEPVLLVPRECNFSQVIITLCRNNSEWLTSLGWYPNEKNIPLNCHAVDGGIAIRIPDRHAETIRNGDQLDIQCSELGFTGKVIWAAAAVDVTPSADAEVGATPPQAPTQNNVKVAAPVQKVQASNSAAIRTTPEGSSQKKMLMVAGAAMALLVIGGGTILLRGGGDKPADKVAAKTQPANPAVRPAVPSTSEPTETAAPIIDKIAPEISPPKKDTKKAVAPKPKAITPPKEKTVKEPTKDIETNLAGIPITPDTNNELSSPIQPSQTQPITREETIIPDAFDTFDVNTEIQSRLLTMEYYIGNIDGKRNIDFLRSVQRYKQDYSIPANAKIDRNFIERLRYEESRYLAAKAQSIRETEALIAAETLRSNEALRAAEAAIARSRQAIPATAPAAPAPAPAPIAPAPVTPPSAQTVIQEAILTPPTQVTPAEATPAPEITPEVPAKEPEISESENSNSEIVKAKLLKQPTVRYPTRLNSRSFKETVTMIVSFDVTEKGEVTNVAIQDSTYDGFHYKHFEKEAIKAARTQKFSPRSVDSEPVMSEDHKLTVTFE